MQTRTILIIDDEINIRENIAEYLQNFDFKTITAENGANGVQLAIENMPDLIICDIDMPVLDGYGVYKQVQQMQGLALTPFIFLTAKSSSQELRTGMLLGADDYITKPFKLNDILMSINKRLEKSEKIKSISEQKLHALTENQLVGVFFYQKTGFIYTNKKFRSILEYKQQELKSLLFENILSGGSKTDNLEKIVACLEGVLDSILIDGYIVTNSSKSVQAIISVQHIEVNGINTLVGMLQLSDSENKKSSNKLQEAYSGIISQLKKDNDPELAAKIETLKAKVDSEAYASSNNAIVKANLSPREKEVLILICNGKTNTEIAQDLFLSNRTVENHRAKLLQKTQSKNTAQLVVFGIKKLGLNI